VDAWQRVAAILVEWYDRIGDQARGSTHLHADETGWRVNGQTHWLWCFANAQVCYYMIDRSRGSPALARFFSEAFGGVLITDFPRSGATRSSGGRKTQASGNRSAGRARVSPYQPSPARFARTG